MYNIKVIKCMYMKLATILINILKMVTTCIFERHALSDMRAFSLTLTYCILCTIEMRTNHQQGSCSTSTNPMQGSLKTIGNVPPPPKRIHLDTYTESLSHQQSPLSVHRNLHSQPTLTPIEIFAGYLRSLYMSRTLPVYGKWPPTPSKQFINLAVILKEKVSRAKADDFTKATLRGNADDILQTKKRIRFSDLAKTKDGEPAQLVLVEGAPGIGKSTFAWEACRKWGAGEILQQYKLMVLLRLREKRVQQAKSIGDLFYYKNDSDSDIKAMVVREIQGNDGAGVLLVFEGFDELPAQLRQENSLFMDIIKGERLTKATILITSRHWASRPLLLNDELHRPLSQHIEILGFTRKDIDDYLECMTFDDPSLLPGLQKYLNCYPNIASMMYVPLNCAIVLLIYCESRSDVNQLIPKTMTELYTSLVRTLLIRYLHNNPMCGDKYVRLDSFSDLPESVYEQFCELVRIAYEGICNDEQIIFSDLPVNFETLGLMQCVPELYVDQGAVVSYNFLHLTLQEFLAAYHVSLMTGDMRIEHLEEGSFMMTEFIAGLTKLNFEEEKLAHFCKFVGNDNDKGWDVSLFHWLFEAQSASLLQKLTNVEIISFNNQLAHNIGNRGPFDYYVLGYCVSHSNCKWNITMNEISKEEAGMFVTGTENCNTLYCGKIVSISANYIDFESVPLTTLSSCLLTELTNLRTCADGGWNDLARLVLHTPQLSELDLSFCTFPPGSAIQLFESLSSLNSFTTLIISDNEDRSLSPEDCQALGGLLSTSKSLTKLVISGCSLVNPGIEYVSNGLKQSTLVDLNISRCDIDSNGAHHIAGGLCCNDTLRELYMGGNPIGDDGATALAQMLTRNKSLNTLNLDNCSITEIGAIHLANALCVNSALQNLDLAYNQIADQGAAALAQMLTRNQSLNILDLLLCSITEVGASHLARALSTNHSITDVWLDNISISRDDHDISMDPRLHP